MNRRFVVVQCRETNLRWSLDLNDFLPGIDISKEIWLPFREIHLKLFPDLWCQTYLAQSHIIFLSSYFPPPPFHMKHPSIFSSNLDLTCWLPNVVPGTYRWLTGISDWDTDMQEERYGGGNTAAGMFSCHSLLLESVSHSRCLSRWHWEVSWKASISPFLGPLQPSIQPLIHPFSSSHPLTRRCE